LTEQSAQERLEALKEEQQQRRLLPGMAIIALYLLAVSAVAGFGVLGHHYPPLYILISAFFAIGSLGLLRMWRVGWALALGGTVLLMAFWLWNLNQTHMLQAGIMAFLNGMIFFYLVRPDVRKLLR
jgi:hypothetical protein